MRPHTRGHCPARKLDSLDSNQINCLACRSASNLRAAPQLSGGGHANAGGQNLFHRSRANAQVFQGQRLPPDDIVP